MDWVQQLTWDGIAAYNTCDRKTLVDPDTWYTEAFLKEYQRFKFFWIRNAGHMVG